MGFIDIQEKVDKIKDRSRSRKNKRMFHISFERKASAFKIKRSEINLSKSEIRHKIQERLYIIAMMV